MSHDVDIPVLQEEDRALIQRAYRNLLKSFDADLEEDDRQMIRSAFELATRAHLEQRRKSGEPYILHPIEVARICVGEIGLGPTAAVCALLHDVVEDTAVTYKDIYRQFGERIAKIVDGLTKLDSLHDSESPQAENLAKVLKAMTDDVRVVLIKMADRLHNLRTIKSMPAHKQLRIAAETSTIYAPLAHRLGLYQIKSEFQDICLKITHPEEYHEIAEKLNQTKRARQEYIEAFKRPLEEALADFGMQARIIGRPKSIYSIWNKIRTKHVVFEDIYDLFAVRIIVDEQYKREKLACWQVYSMVSDFYKPIPERLKDWITNPKANGYESLHTTVVGPEGRYVEVQIRSERMDEIAERGFAAHWKYKGVRALAKNADVFENWLNQVRETLENNDSGSAVEFLTDFQSNLFAEEVHVFTPRGHMRILPEGATALDFAFSIHSDLGSSCQAVRVNNRLVPFHYRLINGDQVQVITSKNQKPTEDWLQYVITSKARNRIRAALKEEKRRQAELGKEILERKLNNWFKAGLEENVDMLAKAYGYPNRLEFLSAIATEQEDLSGMKQRFQPDGSRLVEIEEARPIRDTLPSHPEETLHGGYQHKPKTGKKPEVIINNEPGSYYKYSFATCCNPLQGDPIFAIVTTKDGMKIHRYTCPNAAHLLANYAHRILSAAWGNTAHADFVAGIVVTGIDTGPGVIHQLTDRISNMGLNIRSFSISGEGGYFEGRITLVVGNVDQLNQALRALKSFSYVSSVSRME